jgi:hypothetical protein
MAIFFHMADKLARYAGAFKRGGHVDSLDDLSVYSMMLQEFDAGVTPRRKKGVVLVDIDHTLSDAGWRDPLIADVIAKRITWADYHKDGDKDVPLTDMCRMIETLSEAGHMIVALTSRPEVWRNDTVEWLDKHGITIDNLIMRPDNNFECSPDVKMRLVVEHFGEALSGIELLIDDRADVCQRFRDAGITAIQVHRHTGNHDIPPSENLTVDEQDEKTIEDIIAPVLAEMQAGLDEGLAKAVVEVEDDHMVMVPCGEHELSLDELLDPMHAPKHYGDGRPDRFNVKHK